MYARVTRISLRPDKIEDAIRVTDESIGTDIKKDDGFKGLYVLGNRETGDSMVITMWESPEAEESSREKLSGRFAMLGEFLAGEPDTPVSYEVIDSVMPAKAPTA